MVGDAVGLGGFGKERIPAVALGVSGLLLFLSFAVGWYSVDVRVDHWTYDSSQPENKGNPLLPIVFDLEMRMFSIDTSTRPTQFEQRIQEQGEPTYDTHAGRIGTKMLGVFLLQATSLIVFLAVIVFYAWHRRRDQSETLRRLAVVFMVLGIFTLLYFATTIGGAAQDDTEYLVTQYRFEQQAAYDLSDIEVGFWKTWETDTPQVVTVQGRQEVWEVEAESRPSAGWWLELGAIVVFAVGAYTHASSPPARPVSSVREEAASDAAH